MEEEEQSGQVTSLRDTSVDLLPPISLEVVYPLTGGCRYCELGELQVEDLKDIVVVMQDVVWFDVACITHQLFYIVNQQHGDQHHSLKGFHDYRHQGNGPVVI